MPGKFIIISALIFSVTTVSFFIKKKTIPAESVKLFYLQHAKQFENEIIQLQKFVAAGNERQLKQQFIKTRLAYKQIEVFTEYYFNFFAVKLNGPPIIFFEEDEPDTGEQQPAGMQVIEGMIFPVFNKNTADVLNDVITVLLLDTRTMQATSESNAFNDELIFDAVTEELYRLTALGITGFDSQTAVNSLPETEAAINGLQKIVAFYQDDIKKTIGNQYTQLQNFLSLARNYLRQNPNFNSFNRMLFITSYLNPATKITGEYKMAKGFTENKSPMFYSTIKKTNTLFDSGVFDVNKYLDDNTTSAEKVMLGKKLFFDTQLSADNKRSCATCHNPAKAFTDGLATSVAIDGHTALPRNAPTLWNAALQRNLFLDNRSPSLEDQVMQVLNNASEMHGSAQKAAEKIIAQKEYTVLYAKAYPLAENSSAAQNICNAIACYEKNIDSS